MNSFVYFRREGIANPAACYTSPTVESSLREVHEINWTTVSSLTPLLRFLLPVLAEDKKCYALSNPNGNVLAGANAN